MAGIAAAPSPFRLRGPAPPGATNPFAAPAGWPRQAQDWPGNTPMLQLIVKAALSGMVIAAASETARRWPGWGALIVSLPLVSVLTMMWLWHDTHDRARLEAHAGATFWFVLPSLPMFLLVPALMRAGVSFWVALAFGCALTIGLYSMMVWAGPRFGLKL